MIYSKYKDVSLSALGFGMMRLPGDGYSHIDEEQTELMIDYAIKNGVNYFDTAWGYYNGQSELVTGKLLSKYPRESFYLATKFPGYDVGNFGKAEEIFEEQLKKCRVEYFDFYLMHNVNEKNIEMYLDDEKYGTASYLTEQKAKGRIKHLGFSIHGSYDVTVKFLEKYGDIMEFGQIQLNYIDWHFQDAKAKVDLLNKYNIPIWVMEPLRGGRLTKLNDRDTAELCKARPNESVTAWAFRFLQSVPGVAVILSGMSNLKQLEENIKTFETDNKLTETEFNTIVNIADNIVKEGALPCTGCKYCVDYCPQGLDIPRLLALYNEHTFSTGGFIAPMVVETLPENKRPSACIGCGSCEKVCPQKIEIPDALKKFSAMIKM